MATQQRIKELEGFVDFWEEYLEDSKARFGNLREMQEKLKSSPPDKLDAFIQESIEREDLAMRKNHECFTRMQSTLGRAQNGEDV